MSNHRQATDPGPSLASIWTGALATLVTIALSVWIIWGVPIDERHMMGMALGMLLATLLAAQTIVRALDRETARARQERHRARRVAGTSPAEAVEARWPEPAERGHRYMMFREAPHQGSHLEAMDPESDSYPQDPDPVATQPWPKPIDQPGPWQDREPTQRLTPPQPPSEAALRSIDVPVFRTEADRQAFLDRQDTEIFTRPPDWQS